MNRDKKNIIDAYGNKLRMRVMGICLKYDSLLLVRHKSLGPNGTLYAPPGGGMEFGESAESTLKREFLEETGLEISLKRFMFTHEFLDPPLHAIELFFEVQIEGGKLTTGIDPEMASKDQIIQKVDFFQYKKLYQSDKTNLHHALKKCGTLDELLKLSGYHKFENKSLK